MTDTGCLLVLDDENGHLKNVREELLALGKSNVIYADNVEDARNDLGARTPQIVFLSCADGLERGSARASSLGISPDWIIAAATPEQAEDPVFLRAAMQKRFNNILPLPLGTDDIRAALENGMSNIQGPSSRLGKIVALYSGKGGVGVSTIAVNLGLALNRSQNLEVGLLDLDLQCGSVATLLNIKPTHTLGKLGEFPIEDPETLRDEISSRIATHDSGLRIIASPAHLYEGQEISAELVGQMLQYLRSRFDILIVDTPKWIGDRLVTALDEADRILLVSEPQIPSLAKTRESLVIFSRFEYPEGKVELVFNCVDKKDELQPEDVSKSLKRTVYHSIPAEYARLKDAANKGAPPLLEPGAKGAFAKSILALADKLKSDLGFETPAPAKKRRGFLFGRKAK